MDSKQKCPRCRGPLKAIAGGFHWCAKCRAQVDCEDDGTTGYGDPALIAARNDQHEFNQRQRKKKFGDQIKAIKKLRAAGLDAWDSVSDPAKLIKEIRG